MKKNAVFANGEISNKGEGAELLTSKITFSKHTDAAHFLRVFE